MAALAALAAFPDNCKVAGQTDSVASVEPRERVHLASRRILEREYCAVRQSAQHSAVHRERGVVITSLHIELL